MNRILQILSGAVLAGVLISSCSNIAIDRGPFPISSDRNKIEFKNDWLAEQAEKEQSSTRPNVVIILVDDLGKNDLRLYDELGVEAPYIERLASEGVIFDQAYSSSAVCSPSRAGLFTGRYQQRYGFERQPMNRYARSKMEYFFADHLINTEPMRLISPMAKVSKEEISQQGIPQEEMLISELLQANDYATGLFGKWHLGYNDPFKPCTRGFDYHYGFYEAFSLYAPIRSKDIVNFRHDYFANKHIWHQKRKKTCAIRINDSIVKENEYLTFSIAQQAVDYMEKNKDNPFLVVAAFSAPHTPFQVPLEYYNKFSHIEDENKRVYCGMISALDDGVGMITGALDSLGLSENTLVFFVSDNGGATYTDATDNGSLKAGKFSQFEGGINVPMIVSWKGKIEANRSYEHPVCLLDLYTTIASAASVSLPEDRIYDGVDLLPLLEDPELDAHDFLYWRTDFNRAIRSKRWKLVWNTRDKQDFLYDMEENLLERKNLAAEYPDVVRELKEQYERWNSEMIPPSWPGVMEFKFDIDGEITWWAI